MGVHPKGRGGDEWGVGTPEEGGGIWGGDMGGHLRICGGAVGDMRGTSGSE